MNVTTQLQTLNLIMSLVFIAVAAHGLAPVTVGAPFWEPKRVLLRGAMVVAIAIALQHLAHVAVSLIDFVLWSAVVTAGHIAVFAVLHRLDINHEAQDRDGVFLWSILIITLIGYGSIALIDQRTPIAPGF